MSVSSNIDLKIDKFIKDLEKLTKESELPISVIESIGTNWLTEVRQIKAMKLYQDRNNINKEASDIK